MTNAYDHDDPRNFEDDREEEGRCSECGGSIEDCRCGPNLQPDDVDLSTFGGSAADSLLLFGIPHGELCPCLDCERTYTPASVRLHDAYAFGDVPPPSPIEPFEYNRRRIVQRSEGILAALGVELAPLPSDDDVEAL